MVATSKPIEITLKKLAVMVGRFTVEDEVKAGAMGPNSPAMKFSSFVRADDETTPGA